MKEMGCTFCGNILDHRIDCPNFREEDVNDDDYMDDDRPMSEPNILPVDCEKLKSLVDEILNLRGCEENIFRARSLAYDIRDLIPRYTVLQPPLTPAQKLLDAMEKHGICLTHGSRTCSVDMGGYDWSVWCSGLPRITQRFQSAAEAIEHVLAHLEAQAKAT